MKTSAPPTIAQDKVPVGEVAVGRGKAVLVTATLPSGAEEPDRLHFGTGLVDLLKTAVERRVRLGP